MTARETKAMMFLNCILADEVGSERTVGCLFGCWVVILEGVCECWLMEIEL